MGKEIDSPCTSRCKLKGEVCTGCGRSKDEIRHWKSMKRSEKKVVVGLAATRLKQLRKK
ncbi:DUF1289 domain-containing protein [Herbaspirillum sp. YR522]|uniref:DUF1289 domain-containing protein n=1 Tax=Herbaspirillum sp. YR522 TaxID=1144342 RepID=UPI00026FC540|nr:DUF1289 domain-containing protein [Herbaspirillum sp. YR522]EJM97632.1 putative Fe-S protein [Herbaspirillum sp. YR522]